MKRFIPVILGVLIFTACAKKKAEQQAQEDEKIIQAYIAENSLEATATGSGLHYVINEEGEGASCNPQSTVTVVYTGYLTNGEIFDQSVVAGVTFELQSVIQGWTEGIPYFKEGGHGVLLIPSALGYGTNSVGTIPPNSVLIFDVELVEVL